ncbi:MAG: glutamate mutase L, partial [Anaerolineae bacterium]|nr:glutamate mutase L [Anaerolineae bacterium]
MSILAVDFGSVHTRAVLIDLVDGTYQLVARSQTRTTDGFPTGDVTVGLDRVLRELSEATGRVFTDPDGKILSPEQPDRSGVDLVTITASSGRPLRAIVIGLMPDVSTASAIQAAGTYVDIVASIHLDDGRDEQERLNTILLNTPDLILIAGGTEQGAEGPIMELVRIVRLALALTESSHRPIIVYAGNSVLHDRLKAQFEGVTKLLVAANVRPTLGDEKLDSVQARLGQAFNLYKEQRSPDFAGIAAMSSNGLQPTARSYATVLEYLAQTYKGNVLAVDVGSATSTLAVSINGQTNTAIRSNMGVGHNANNLIKALGGKEIRRWLPFNVMTTELLNYAANKALRPATIPNTLRDVSIEHALYKAAVHTLMQDSRQAWHDPAAQNFSLIIGAGSTLNGVGHPAYSALLLLDAIQPTGITTIVSDPFALIPALGSIAAAQPEAVVQVLEGQNLEPVGTVFNLSGVPRLDKPALKVKITLADGNEVEEVVNGGHLWVYPLPVGQTAEVRIRVQGRGLAVGAKRRIKVTVEGGDAGLIFDARGRPLNLATDIRVRAIQMPQWIAEVTGDELQVIDPRWLYDLEPEHIQAAKKIPRRGWFGRRRQPTNVPLPDSMDDDDLVLET